MPPPPPEDKKLAQASMVLATSDDAVISNLLSRKRDEPDNPLEPVSNTVKVLSRLSEAISNGQDIAPIRTEIVRIVSNQPEKADVFQGVMNVVDQERLADMTVMRARVEKELKRAVNSGGLTYGECIAVWNLTNAVIEKIQSKAAKLNKPVDSGTVISKVDVSQVQSEKLLHDKWEGTTPQGRQIIRMKLFELKRHVAVEIEQHTAPQPVIDVK